MMVYRTSGLPIFLLIAMPLVLSSCVIQRWESLPVPSEAIPATGNPSNPPISFYIPQYLTQGPGYSRQLFAPPPQFAYKVFQQKISEGSQWERVQFTHTPSDRGLMYTVRVTDDSHPVNGWTSTWMVLTPLTLWLIPSTDDTLEYRVTYEVYIDAKIKKQYSYVVHGKTIQWAFALAALPFLSGTGWEVPMDPHRREGGNGTDMLSLALWSTMRQFWLDASHDGVF